MKSSEWIRQEQVDEAADAIIRNGQAKLDDISGYQVAKYLECSANTSLYNKFYDWRKRKISSEEATGLEVPDAMAEALRTALYQSADATRDLCLKILRAMAVSIDGTANLRVASANQEADRAKAMHDEIFSRWEATEDQLDVVTRERDALADEIEQLKAERGDLKGEVKALQILIARFGEFEASEDGP